MDWKNLRVAVSGGGGFLGRVVCRKLLERGVREANLGVPRSAAYDLTSEADVIRMYDDMQPEVVIHLGGAVGGIGANRDHPGRFFFANCAMGLHLIEHGRRRKIRKFVQASSVSVYPKFAEVPFREENIWNGYPEDTNGPYGIAKRAMHVMLDAYKREYGLNSAVLVPINLYGPEDNFHPDSSHVIPALVRRCVEAARDNAEKIVCWGTGSASREFLYVDDAAEAFVLAVEKIDEPAPINLGTGSEVTIKDIVELIAKLSGFRGLIEWDTSKPDGQARRSVDIGRAKKLLNWRPKVALEEGLRRTIEWYKAQKSVREVNYG